MAAIRMRLRLHPAGGRSRNRLLPGRCRGYPLPEAWALPHVRVITLCGRTVIPPMLDRGALLLDIRGRLRRIRDRGVVRIVSGIVVVTEPEEHRPMVVAVVAVAAMVMMVAAVMGA